MKRKKTIYIPIEIKYRELTSQVLLAYYAAKRGYRVYIGTKPAIAKIIKHKSKGGIYLYKGSLPLDYMKYVDSKSDAFVIIDQEIGPKISNYEKTIPTRFRPGTQIVVDRYYTIGTFATKAAIKTLNELRGKIVTTGWPRVDLWRPEFRNIYEKVSNKYRDRYGEFLLFSSDFGFTSEERIYGSYRQNLESENPYLKEHADKKRKNAEINYSEFQKFIRLLRFWDKDSEIPVIVVRPHPAEDINAWVEALKGFRKTICVYEGEITEWIYASKGVLHRGCTTAVQSHMMGIPTAYVVINEKNIRYDLPYKLSAVIRNKSDLNQWLKNISEGNTKNDLKNSNFEDAESELSKRVFMTEKLSVDLIVDDFETLPVRPEAPWDSDPFVKARVLLQKAKSYSSKLLKRLRKSNNNYHNKYGIAPKKQKVPGGITVVEIEKFLFKIAPNEGLMVKQGGINNAVRIEMK